MWSPKASARAVGNSATQRTWAGTWVTPRPPQANAGTAKTVRLSTGAGHPVRMFNQRGGIFSALLGGLVRTLTPFTRAELNVEAVQPLGGQERYILRRRASAKWGSGSQLDPLRLRGSVGRSHRRYPLAKIRACLEYVRIGFACPQGRRKRARLCLPNVWDSEDPGAISRGSSSKAARQRRASVVGSHPSCHLPR